MWNEETLALIMPVHFVAIESAVINPFFHLGKCTHLNAQHTIAHMDV